MHTCILLLVLTAPALAAPSFIPGRILVKPKANVSKEEAQALWEQNGAATESEIHQIGVHVLRLLRSAKHKFSRP